MPVDAVGPLAPLARLQPLTQPGAATGAAAPGGFAGVLNDLLAANTRANETANAAIRDLATGQAQDLHTVTLALAQADTSFRFLLELRNRVTDAFQEISRMQV
ncbi:MAG TPA: flagellar hook-basal body complex protein FliE [Urbifossiella sp.]|jgi:flagellar hook-basal body complex protein FliE|nr:flagellar hook-basal body complex protein FliE [Urbifossiella sp.]